MPARGVTGAVLLCLLLVASEVRAQEEVTGQVWIDYLTDWHVTSRHLVELEVGPGETVITSATMRGKF